MSEELPVSADAQMIASIQADAESQAKRLLDEARSAADAEQRRTDEEAEAVRTEIVRRASEKARRGLARAQAVATAEARRIVLRARESAVQSVLERVRGELDAMRANEPVYRESLLALAKEALRGVASPDARLALAEADRPLTDAAFLDELRSDVGQWSGAKPQITLVFDLPAGSGGCIAQSPNGRIIFDNTLTQRFVRAQRSLRTAILREAGLNHE